MDRSVVELPAGITDGIHIVTAGRAVALRVNTSSARRSRERQSGVCVCVNLNRFCRTQLPPRGFALTLDCYNHFFVGIDGYTARTLTQTDSLQCEHVRQTPGGGPERWSHACESDGV